MPHHILPRYAAKKVLQAMEEASEVSECRLGFEFDGEDWVIGDNAYSLKFRRRSDLSAGFIAELARDRHRLDYIMRLCRFIENAASKQLAIHDKALKPIAKKLSRGVAKIPDEILGLVFKFATNDEQEGTRHALWLAQVSQRFRRIALGDRTLWTTPFFCYDSLGCEAVDAYIDRSGTDTDLNIVVHCDEELDDYNVKQFIYSCSGDAHRWKSLTLDGDWNERFSLGQTTVGFSLCELITEVELDLPRLQELRLLERRCDKAGAPSWYTRDSTFAWEVKWTTPSLRILRCDQYIPPPTFPFMSISSLTISLTLLPGSSDDQFCTLCAFLLDRLSLIDIDIELINSEHDESVTEDELTVTVELALPSVKSFRLSVQRFESTQELRWIPEPFVKALRLPNLEQFSLSTDFLAIPHKLIPNAVVHPRISTVSLEIPKFDPKTTMKKILESKIRNLLIPLDAFPNVSSLSVTTAIEGLSFFRGWDSSESRVAGKRLRELCLRSCRGMDIEGLESVVRSLEGLGAWERMDRVAIETCDLLEYDAAAEVVGKEKLHFSRS